MLTMQTHWPLFIATACTRCYELETFVMAIVCSIVICANSEVCCVAFVFHIQNTL